MAMLKRSLTGLVLVAVLCSTQPAAAQTARLRGWESSVDFLTSRSGEGAVYFGGFENNHSLGFRFSILDEREAVPCGAGVSYGYVSSRTRPSRLQLDANASAGRLFSCETERSLEERRLPANAYTLIAAGLRLPVLTSPRFGTALRVQVFAQKFLGHDAGSDVTTKGLLVGFVMSGQRGSRQPASTAVSSSRSNLNR
jgi:hypothetical protein